MLSDVMTPRRPLRLLSRFAVLLLVPGSLLVPAASGGQSADRSVTVGLAPGVTPHAGIGLRPVGEGPALGVLLAPRAVAVDGRGGFYLADGNGRVEHVDAAGRLTVVAGSGRNAAPVPGPALQSPLTGVQAVATDRRGTVYLSVGAQVLSVGPDAQLRVVAGDGTQGQVEPGPATGSPLSHVSSLAVAADGTLLIGDVGNHRLLAVGPDGRLRVVAGNGSRGQARPGDPLRSPLTPQGITVSPDGTLHVSHFAEELDAVGPDSFVVTNRYQSVVRIDGGTRLSVVAGTGAAGDPRPGPAADTAFQQPTGVSVAPDGALYVADVGAGVLVRIGPDGQADVVAGNGGSSRTGHDGPATSVPLQPLAVAVDVDGSLLLTDVTASAVSRLDRAGSLTVVAGQRYVAPHPGPALESSLVAGALAHDPRRGLLVMDQGSNTLQLVDGSGQLVHLLGNGDVGRPQPGPALASPLRGVAALAVGPDGAVYLVDKAEFMVLRLTPAGDLELVAESPGSPAGVAVDGAGNVYFADCFNGRLVRVLPDGSHRVVVDRSTPLPAELRSRDFNPFSTVATADGTVFTYDGGNGAILKISPAGRISTVAGPGSGTALDRRLGVSELAVHPDGSVVLATGTQLWRLQADGVVTRLLDGERPVLHHGSSRLTIEAVAVDPLGALYVGSRLSTTVNRVDLDAAQPEPERQLRAERLTWTGTGARRTAILHVRNLGSRAEPEVVVGLTVHGRLKRSTTISLAAGAQAAVRFGVRRAWVSGSALRGSVDPFDSVPETDESDNEVARVR